MIEPRDPFAAIETALENIGPCDTDNVHVEVWCIAHQQKRCHAEAETKAAYAALATLREEQERTEDFRAEIALEAFTAPDADWDTILDSLRARMRDGRKQAERQEAALRECLRHLDFEAGDDDQYATGAREAARAALSPSSGDRPTEQHGVNCRCFENPKKCGRGAGESEPERCPNVGCHSNPSGEAYFVFDAYGDPTLCQWERHRPARLRPGHTGEETPK